MTKQLRVEPDSTPSRRSVLRYLFGGVCLCLIVMTLIWIRSFQESKTAYGEGIAALERAERVRAVTFFDRSIHWYAPFNPFPRRSAQRLWDIARHGERTGDIRLALIATRAIRRGFLATGGLYTPGKTWIERAERKVAALTSEGTADAGAEPHAPGIGTRQQNKPDTVWTLLLAVGLAGWISSVGAFLLYGLKDDGERGLKAAAGLAYGIPFFLFYALWIIGMAKA